MGKLTILLESPNPPAFTDQANDLIVTALNDLGPELENISGQLFDLGHLTYTSVTQQLSDMDDDEDITVRELITKALIAAINQRISSPPTLMSRGTTTLQIQPSNK